MASTVDPQTTATDVAQKEASQKKDRGMAATADGGRPWLGSSSPHAAFRAGFSGWRGEHYR